MGTIKDIVKNVNERLCSEDGVLTDFCKSAITGKNKNYIFMVGVALFVQYLLPLIMLFIVIPIVIGNAISLGIIIILGSFNPFAFLLIIPLVAVDLGIVIIFIIISLVLMIVYWLYYFKEIGILVVIPILACFTSIIVGFVPYIGNILSSIISITPWMAIAVIAHYLFYSNKKMVVDI